MDIVLLLERKIIIDNKLYLLNINSSSKKISGDQYSSRCCSKFIHNPVSFILFNTTMHVSNDEVFLDHSLCKGFYVILLVAINHALGDFKVAEQFTKCIKLPFYFLNWDIKLFDTFKGKVFFLY